MIVTHKIKMDLMQRGVTPRVDVVQGDICSRQLELSLFSGGKEWLVPDATNVAVRYCKSDKTKGYYDTMPDGTQAWSVQGNRLTVMLVPQMLTAEGPVLAQVEMIQGTKLLATFTVQVYVNANPAEGIIQSENYVNWLQWMEDELDRHMQGLTDALEEMRNLVDTTLSVAGKAADAAVTGTRFGNLQFEFSNLKAMQQMDSAQIWNLQKVLTAQDENINLLTEEQNTHSSQIATLQKQMFSYGNRVSVAEEQLTAMDQKVEDLETELQTKATLLQVYPVGAIYLSVTNKNPATLFGGTWTQLKDRFLLGAGSTYSNGATGGSATHKLSVSELPSHTHELVMASSNNGTSGYSTNQLAIGVPGTTYENDNPVIATGENAEHNNMPPYLVVYMWKRTA